MVSETEKNLVYQPKLTYVLWCQKGKTQSKIMLVITFYIYPSHNVPMCLIVGNIRYGSKNINNTEPFPWPSVV